jgi:hypothetical protein
VAALIVGCTVWLSFGVLAVVDTNGTRVGVLPPLWWLALTILIPGSAVVALRLSWQSSLPLLLSLVVVLPWLPVPIPDLFLIWTGPSILILWVGIVLCMSAVLTTMKTVRLPALFSNAVSAPRVAGLIAFAAFMAVRLAAAGPPGGDQPHYLLVSQSLLKDGDIKVANNYERQDYLAYWHGNLQPHYSRPGINGELYSGHAPGLPALIAPAFAIGGYWGAVAWIALLSALGSIFVWQAGYAFTRDVGSAWFGWSAVILTVPMLFHGTLVYPDAIAGVMLAGGTLAVVVARERPRGWQVFCSGVPVALLPWLHTRLALPAAVLGFVLLLRFASAIRRRAATWRDLAAFLTPIVLSLGGWFFFFRIVYGTFSPSAPQWDRVPLSLGNIPTGLSGLLADQEFGLLPNAPVHILLGAGIWSVFRRDRRLALELLLIVVPYVIAASGFSSWYAGASPPARYLLPVILPVGVAFASLWAHQDQSARSLSFALLALSLLIASLLAFGGDGGLAQNEGTGRARWLDWSAPLVDLPRAFPSFFRAAGGGAPRASAIQVHLLTPAFVWAVSLLVGWLLFRVLAKGAKSAGMLGLVTSCCLLGVLGLGVGVNWIVAGGTHTTSTRSQLRLLRSESTRQRSYGVRLPGLRVLPAALARSELALTTSRFDDPPPGAFLYLSDVPPGEYQLRVRRGPSAHGDLMVGVGRATVPAWRLSLADPQSEMLEFHLPVIASSLVVTADAEGTRSIEGVTLVPAPYREQLSDTRTLRARDAARYGEVLVFTTDDRAMLDARGFWVLGGRQPEVVVHTDAVVHALDLELRNVSVSNRVGLWAGRWSVERDLAPDETWRIRVPAAGLGRTFRVGFRVERGLPPGKGLLGCRVEIH